MQTGQDITGHTLSQAHCIAVVTGATAVFLRELCHDIALLRLLPSSQENLGDMAKACACRIMHTSQHREMEAIVEAVLAHKDGMPEIQNKTVLAEIMACYTMARQAEISGTAKHFRQNILVPAIVEEAFEASESCQRDAEALLKAVQPYSSMWKSYTPSSPFQVILHDAINNVII